MRLYGRYQGDGKRTIVSSSRCYDGAKGDAFDGRFGLWDLAGFMEWYRLGDFSLSGLRALDTSYAVIPFSCTSSPRCSVQFQVTLEF
jgi:hypothetical protein